MTLFDTITVIDWSGGNDRGATPKADAIWAAVSRAGHADAPLYLRNRKIAEDWLCTLIEEESAAGRRLFLGFDFPFGFPSGFAKGLIGHTDPLAVWDWLEERLEDTPKTNNRFDLAGEINGLFPGVGPFWFNGVKRDIPGLPHKGRDRHDFGLAEHRLADARAKGAFSVWQLGGAGAVGSQALTGLAVLSRLRKTFSDKISAWPFEALNRAVALVEVWPSLISKAIAAQTNPGEVKDAAQVRVLTNAIWRMQSEGTLSHALQAPPEALTEEGWIFGVGAEETLRAAATPLTPPRLRNDCFAMPQGVAWVPVEDALAKLRTALAPVVETETVPTIKASGRVLASAALARRSNPPTANAAVDGYGFAHAATGSGIQKLPLVEGRAAAGQPFKGEVPKGHAIRILTGAILPDGVDTIVLEEDCATDGVTVAFDGPVKPGANSRAAAEDVKKRADVLPQGRRLTPPDLAILSAVGVAEVSTYRPLRVGVLSTGDEIVSDPAQSALPHQIYDANRPMLLSLAQKWGYEPVDLGHVRDVPKTISHRLDQGAETTDVILTSGGASAGDEDHVSTLLRDQGTLSSWRIAMKPGRPLALALWNGTPVFGLPGNPVAAFVCALIFARPALSLMSGAGWSEPQSFTVPAAFSKRKKAGRREYLRARLNPKGHAEVFSSEGSGRISGLSWATGLVELPNEPIMIEPGYPVKFLPYSGLGIC